MSGCFCQLAALLHLDPPVVERTGIERRQDGSIVVGLFGEMGLLCQAIHDPGLFACARLPDRRNHWRKYLFVGFGPKDFVRGRQVRTWERREKGDRKSTRLNSS